jgi:transposase-like protein
MAPSFGRVNRTDGYSRSVSTTATWQPRRHYGIAEIADALGVDRQLVTVWRRRASHGMPAPDDELAAGPLWLAHSIEPWIALTRARLEAEEAARGAEILTPRLARQVARRFFRLLAALLEEPLRPRVAQRAIQDLAELAEPMAEAMRAPGGDRRGLAQLARVAQLAAVASRAEDTDSAFDRLVDACLATLPEMSRVLTRAVGRDASAQPPQDGRR